MDVRNGRMKEVAEKWYESVRERPVITTPSCIISYRICALASGNVLVTFACAGVRTRLMAARLYRRGVNVYIRG